MIQNISNLKLFTFILTDKYEVRIKHVDNNNIINSIYKKYIQGFI